MLKLTNFFSRCSFYWAHSEQKLKLFSMDTQELRLLLKEKNLKDKVLAQKLEIN